MIKDPWGSMATKHTLRMLGVSEAEMPHILHISFRRRLSDWRFLLLSRILQSERQESREKGMNEQVTHCYQTHLNAPFFGQEKAFRHASPPYLLTLRVLSCQAGQSPPSRGPMSFVPVPSTNPKVSAGQAVVQSPFSSVPCRTHIEHMSETLFSIFRTKNKSIAE